MKILTNNLTERHARALLKLNTKEEVDDVIDVIVEKKLNVNQTENLIERIFSKKDKKKKNFIPIIKDIKIFYNTINSAVKTMRKAGVMANIQKTHEKGYIKYIVKIPNNSNK